MRQYESTDTLTPQIISDSFRRAYKEFYGHDVNVVHCAAEWYQVNGEYVHRITMLQSLEHLREMQRARQAAAEDKRSTVRRLIAKIRGL